jgi:hypothetical protein
MKFNKEICEKIRMGDSLTDTELELGCEQFQALEQLLCRMGPEWDLARRAAISEFNKLEDFRWSRKRAGKYAPKTTGVFDINYRDGGYHVSIPNYDGGKVVTLEHHEAVVAEARMEGRFARPSGSAVLTVEVLENLRTVIASRWKGGHPHEVIDDIVENAVDPAINMAKAAAKLS